ncbi:DUF4407 domain-containing protein [Herbiconiux flava]|uniref:Type III secretory pathway component EscS n=1 Tax=Herbiconiux flava TaxID=881268 RepID=A0A852SQH7_9MICO|nr:DUF4407 domain-containing protein [Herbiconiux flava]NYD71025.1 type III secretory pathway component EscS [Herbiconiux flava]GLK19011.1 hypothetical protein GCM10017602_34930 [Herbiconiux flava]
MARRYNSNPVSNFMSWLGGARLDVLQDAPGDRARFVAMGGVILSTAFLSAVSAAFALVMAVGAPIVVAVIVGIFWGLIILNLDRLLIIGMAKQKGVWRNLALAMPRVALALIIGTVISTPLTLQIFQAEINSEIQVMQAEDKSAFEERMANDPRFAAIPSLEESIAANQAIVDKGLQTDLSSDPNYAAAVAATAAAQAAYDQAQAAYLAEIDGSGGTGVRGDGPVTASKQAALDAASARLQAAQDAQAAAETAASSNLEASAQSRLEAATSQLAADKATLATAQDQRSAEQAAYDNAVDNSAGLLSRLEALFRLGEANPLLNVAHIMIALLFICIELLPVIVKTLANLGGPTAYDRLVDVREDGEVSGGSVWASKRAEAIEVEAGVQVSVAADRAERQVEFGRRVNQAVLEQQEAVISRALEVWGRYAGERAEARMGEWERSLEASEGAGAGGTGAGVLGAGAATSAGSGAPGVLDAGAAAAASAQVAGRPEVGSAAAATGRDQRSPVADARRNGAWWRGLSGRDSAAAKVEAAREAEARDLAFDDAAELEALFGDTGVTERIDTGRDAAERLDTGRPDADRLETERIDSYAGRASARDDTETKPLPQNSDRAAYLRRAGLPEDF